MYCYTKMNDLTCVLNELLLWSHISSEHPIFIKTVADLSQKDLPANINERLLLISKAFQTIQQNVSMIKRSFQTGSTKNMTNLDQVVNVIDQFLKHDEYVIGYYPELKKYGKNDPTWQTLIEHIIHEQQFMHELMSDLRSQLVR